MTRAQYRAARRALKQENACRLAGKYHSYRTGATCAIGALAIEAGVKPSYFRHDRRNGDPVYALPKVTAAIKQTFGLDEDVQVALQRANDSVCPPARMGSLDPDELRHKHRLGKVLKVLSDAYNSGK
ncbi:MAG: hypothetical protein E6Q97_05655 [Desulfurellales bacterium]|nr:MAG: hypothetical protein E6Q97_05655 [Desulfurellales bacterium]